MKSLANGFVTIAALCALSSPLFAAVTGTVINKTTGKPQAGATVALNKLDPQLGITMVDQAKSGADGSFTINQDTGSGVPYLIRAAYDGVTYNLMIPPGTPSTGLKVEVYDATKQPGAAKVSKHMLLFQPAGGQMTVNETYLYENPGQSAWNDPGVGTLHFYLPAGAGGKVQAEVTAPGSVPIGAPTAKTAKTDVYEIDYPVKPGETRFDLTYAVPYTEGAPYEGKIVTKDENTYLIVPNGVTMAGEGLNDLGQEPKTQAHLYGFSGSSYKVQLTGAAAPTAADNSDAGAASDDRPQIDQIMPRLYDKTIPILAIAFGILGLGFALLYRAHGTVPAKESNERGRG
ncbi:MAG TPA: carboxypeptidase-like regulatory domain-containing protein [Bryobacteraceae bacterium]|jgi:hypothetical protein|nr:carboxypeptidase-like regulatory domain-containing protein [Bryobacteraceae bacterium]